MSENKQDTKNKCSCGDDRVMLTEDLRAVPRCAGCGKPIKKDK